MSIQALGIALLIGELFYLHMSWKTDQELWNGRLNKGMAVTAIMLSIIMILWQ